jgi:hypothetical protein
MPRALLFFSVALLLSFALESAFAQSASGPQGQAAAPVGYNAANELVVRGTIAQVVTHPAPGLPLGLHLMVSSTQGVVDAHLGPYLAPVAGQKGLAPGAAVQMLGVITHLPAGDVFLVRAISVGSETIVVRSRSGIPVRQLGPAHRVVRGADQQKDGL